ncbi:MAG: indole-3-glycerol phosphate synthase TrpC [Bacteroidota bacterium]
MAEVTNVLDEIVAHKRKEVAEKKELFPTKLLEQSLFYAGSPVSLKRYLQREDRVGIIAEIKRKSPSKGAINQHVSVEKTSIGYMQAGASGLSILTDSKYFGGKNEDLQTARKFNFCPILRKDFILEEYQIVEAKSIGADVILLIAACLSSQELKGLSDFAHTLGLEVLLEVHNEEELEKSLEATPDMIGVNNRDLQTFTTSVETSLELASKIPDQFVKVSESGISEPEVVAELMRHGYEGFLIGEYFMQHGRPSTACSDFVRDVKALIEKK